MRLLILCLVVSFVASFGTVERVHACGANSDCKLVVEGNERHYRIRMPETHDGKTPVGAIVFFHGYKGSASGLMRNKAFGKAVSDAGLALIAPKSFGDDWVIPNAPNAKAIHRQEVELKYIDALLADVTGRFSIDRDRIMASGFSAGGMMTWTLICHRSEAFAGFAPIAGTFWDPVPATCDTEPAHVLHTHGTADKVVPITGRRIADTKQGNVLEVLAMYSQYGAYKNPVAAEEDDLNCQRQISSEGKVLELCLHDRGHDFRSAHVLRAWNELTKIGALN